MFYCITRSFTNEVIANVDSGLFSCHDLLGEKGWKKGTQESCLKLSLQSLHGFGHVLDTLQKSESCSFFFFPFFFSFFFFFFLFPFCFSFFPVAFSLFSHHLFSFFPFVFRFPFLFLPFSPFFPLFPFPYFSPSLNFPSFPCRSLPCPFTSSSSPSSSSSHHSVCSQENICPDADELQFHDAPALSLLQASHWIHTGTKEQSSQAPGIPHFTA